MSNTKKFLIIGAVALAIAVAISFFNPVKPASDHTLYYRPMHAKGYSMSGYYQRVQGIPIESSTDFRIIVDETVPFEKLKVGDPVIFRHRFWNLGEKNMIHHLVHEWSPNKKAFKAKGYYNDTDDGVWVEEIDYIGKVTHVYVHDQPVQLKD